MRVIDTEIEGVVLIEPDVFEDARGAFLETWQQRRYAELGLPAFVQDNVSYSAYGVLRGLHLQNPTAQAKLVQALKGELYDVAVDVRHNSPTFGKWVGAVLSEDNHYQFFIPAGFAHGFCVLSDTALLAYKCSDFYAREDELTIRWDDPDIAIDWPIDKPLVSQKDAGGAFLKDIAKDRLPEYAGRN